MRADGLGHWGDNEQGPQQLSPWSRLIGQRKRGRREGTRKAGGRGIEDNGARSLTPKQACDPSPGPLNDFIRGTGDCQDLFGVECI